jgi:hypothetical protein
MFKATAPAALTAPVEVATGIATDLIPLSVLRLDLDPGEPWYSFLGRRGRDCRLNGGTGWSEIRKESDHD